MLGRLQSVVTPIRQCHSTTCHSTTSLQFVRYTMSYRHGGAGGYHTGRGRGGPNRGGGRRGRGRGASGGHPSHLKGSEIGMYYASRSKKNKEERERKSRAVLNIDKDAERNISQVLSDIHSRSGSDLPARAEASGFFSSMESESVTNETSSTTDSCWSSLQGTHELVDYGNSAAGPSTFHEENRCFTHQEEQDPPGLIPGFSPGLIQQEPPPPRFSNQAAKSSRILVDDEEVDASLPLVAARRSSSSTEWRTGPLGDRSVMNEEDKKLKDSLEEAQRSNERFKKMMEFRQRLPSWKAQDELLHLIKTSQVCVVSGETGCGKTTQVPQFILDDAIMNGWGSKCHVICTQPRRISAISVAQRVAAERGESLGASAGYQIRLEHTFPRTKGSILYCTTGVLLRKLIGDPELAGVSHVIMDEVHERNITCDFLSIIMREMLPRRPDMKLILMSATLNADLFSEYFNKAPMFTIKNVAYPVTEYFLEDIISSTGYQPDQSSKQSKSRPHWTRYGEGKEEFQRKMDEQREKEEYFNSLESKRVYPPRVVESLRRIDEKDIDLKLVMTLIRHICCNHSDGAILVFLPGWDTISKLHDMLMASPVFRGRDYLIIPLHSMMPTAVQQKVFDRPPQGVRKIVIATNIAETSITIDDVVYVIDCGKVKETTYDVAHQMACLNAVWVSKAAARQRRGRAGRVQEGHCFHVFTRFQHDKMAEFQQPEMLRTPLEELVLQIKVLKLGKVIPFLQKAIEPPEEKAVHNALQCLHELKALTGDEELTPLGYHLANLPVNPRIGKIILFGAIFSCLDPVLTIASSLGFKEPFVIPLHKQEEADAMKRRLARDSRSDHITLLRAYEGWKVARSCGNARHYCWENFLANNTLELLSNMKKQFAGLLHDTGFIQSSNPEDVAANFNSDNMKLVKAVLCAGLYPNVIQIQQNKPGSHPKLFTKGGKVKFHPKSVNCDETTFENKHLIYHTKVKSTAVFVHDTSSIPPFPLLFFGGDISVQSDEGTVSVDGWIIFQASQNIAELVKEMRKQLDVVLQQKVAQPSMELYNPHNPTATPASQLIHAIIDLITREDYTHQRARVAAGKHLYVRGK